MASLKSAMGLAQIRAAKGVSLSQVAEKTKISKFFLQAIEEEQFAKLPGGVFDHNYIRQYAAAVGITDAALLERYKKWRAESEPVEQKSSVRGWLSSLLASVLN